MKYSRWLFLLNLIKKAKFSSSDPTLTDSQLNQKTALYFRKLSEKKFKPNILTDQTHIYNTNIQGRVN